MQMIKAAADAGLPRGKAPLEILVEDRLRDALGCEPVTRIAAIDGQWIFARWRGEISRYRLVPLPDPVVALHWGGKPRITAGGTDDDLRSFTKLGTLSVVPAGLETAWNIDGSFDLLTFSISSGSTNGASTRDFSRLTLGVIDPLALSLGGQMAIEAVGPCRVRSDTQLQQLGDMLLAHLLHGLPITRPQLDTPNPRVRSVQAAIDAIHHRPGSDHRIDLLAERARWTPSYFARVFKQVTGDTPHRYVERVRFDHARTLLESTDMPVAAIALELGYNSHSHFTRQFRTVLGTTPDHLRRSKERNTS
jgi:AraC family transcriptional regulator